MAERGIESERESGRRFDVVGDVHGMLATFRALLERLGYRKTEGRWRAPHGRRLMQVGDLLDRGPDPLGAAELMEELVRDGVGEHVLGNHEYNAVAWFHGVRRRVDSNRRSFHPTLEQIHAAPERWRRVEAFLRTRPLWLETGGVRFVHAAFDAEECASLPSDLGDSATVRRTRSDHRVRDAIEFVLKGPEEDVREAFVDPNGITRRRRRIAWWDRYPADAPPVFFGHYWFHGLPRVLGPGGNAVCLDYSCGRGGPLMAYRYPEGIFVEQRNLDVVAPSERRRAEETVS
jgi:hypothetical protein